MDQWTEGILWFLEWRKFVVERGELPASVPERVYKAVMDTGGRRGLARRTRQTYAKWVFRFAQSVGSSKKVMQQECCREWFWLFPAKDLSRDLESGIIRRHHLHEKVYGAAV